MRIPKELKYSINTYYAFKNLGWDGMFRGDTKERCCVSIIKVATKFGIGCAIAPGTIFLMKGKQKSQIDGPFLPD